MSIELLNIIGLSFVCMSRVWVG